MRELHAKTSHLLDLCDISMMYDVIVVYVDAVLNTMRIIIYVHYIKRVVISKKQKNLKWVPVSIIYNVM